VKTISVPVKKIEQFFTVFSLIVLTDPASLVRFISDIMLGGKVSLFMNIFYLVIACISSLLLAIRWKNTFNMLKEGKNFLLLLALIVLIFISCLWSSSTLVTLKRATILLQVTFFGLYFATRFKPREQLQLLCWALGISAFMSFMFVWQLPEYGVMGMGKELVIGGQEDAHSGAWRGIYAHKNPLGRIMALSGIIFLLASKGFHKHKWLMWIGLFLSISLALISKSSTAIIIFLTLIILTPIYRLLRLQSNFLIIFSIIMTLVVGSFTILLFSNADTFAAAFGKDLTFSGRTELWTAVLDEIWQKPWLGYGYRAYWRGFTGPSAVIWSKLPWLPPHSHNGALDVWLELGLLGLLVFTAGFVALCLQSISWTRHSRVSTALFPILYLTFVALSNLTESSLLVPNIFWILYISLPFIMRQDFTDNIESKQMLNGNLWDSYGGKLPVTGR
jgi:exopolysaccharide production protein ExoQ